MVTEHKRQKGVSGQDIFNEHPLVVVGSGPVGIRVVDKILERCPGADIVIYGDEPWDPYNRVKLSTYLAGETSIAGLNLQTAVEAVRRFNCRVESIDRESRCVIDNRGRSQPYSKLILATGSKPHIPEIAGIRQKGVYTFRDMTDAQSLLKQGQETRRIIILGGGLLGLEAAKAMRRFNAEITVIEHNTHLMFRQLDYRAAGYLRNHIESLGIRVLLSERIIKVTGGRQVNAVILGGGDTLECDMLILATGIRPNIELALSSGLHVNRGVRVNDRLQSSDADIFAVGECAEHRDVVYGLVAPGYEQAAVVAHVIAGGTATYAGSVSATSLKVTGKQVFSMGRIGETAGMRSDSGHVHEKREQTIYRKVFIHRNRLAGVIAIGDWPELGRVQEAVLNHRYLWPWQLYRFRASGSLWSGRAVQSVAQWPANAIVCNCTGVTRGALAQSITAGCQTVDSIAARTGASTVCGSCKPLLHELIGSTEIPGTFTGGRILAASVFAALLLVMATLISPVISYAATVQVPWHWDLLWRESTAKQVTGYSLLGLMVAVSLLSLRKRWRPIRKWGKFSMWRILHSGMGALIVAVLIAHTGFRMGSNLNFILMSMLIGSILIGTVAGAIIVFENRLGTAVANKLRNQSVWAHIVLFWPLPALLLFHVLKTYYY